MNYLEPVDATLNEPAPPKTVANVGPNDMATNEERTLPLGAGVIFCPALLIGQVYNQYAVDAPMERPGKK